MSNRNSQYPDIAEILARKASGRRQQGALSFVEKLAILDALKERIEPFVRAREMRKHRRQRAEINAAGD